MMKLNKLSPTLYQCDYKTAVELMTDFKYKEYGIKGVICPAYNAGIDYPIGLASLVLPIDDYDDIDESVFELVVSFCRLYSPVLIHCMGGKNRSVAFCAAVLGDVGIYDRLGHWPTEELQDSVRRFLV